MKIVFAGTPIFAAQALRAIDRAGHEIVLVLTQPDRRAGRGMQLHASPVKAFALEKNIPILQPATLQRNSADSQKRVQAQDAYDRLSHLSFDAMVVVAYGLILPQEILDLAKRNGCYGCFNIHASLLPRWRGAAPIQRSIESGDSKTGISIMQMDAGLDTGDTVLVREVSIDASETGATLHDRLAVLGADLMVEILCLLDQGQALNRTLQPKDGITYASKILKAEGQINWSLSAPEIDRRIRAFNPFPGATSCLNAEAFKFWTSAIPTNVSFVKTGAPGEVMGFEGKHVYIQCGQGVIEIHEMQKPGGKRMDACACLKRYRSQEKIIQFLKE